MAKIGNKDRIAKLQEEHGRAQRMTQLAHGRMERARKAYEKAWARECLLRQVIDCEVSLFQAEEDNGPGGEDVNGFAIEEQTPAGEAII